MEDEQVGESNVAKIEVRRAADGQFYWRAKAANGEIVATGEMHPRLADARRAGVSAFPSVPVDASEDED